MRELSVARRQWILRWSWADRDKRCSTMYEGYLLCAVAGVLKTALVEVKDVRVAELENDGTEAENGERRVAARRR